MSTHYTRYLATVDCSKIEAWENHELNNFLFQERDGEGTVFELDGVFKIFEYCGIGDDPDSFENNGVPFKAGEASSLYDILSHFSAKCALSLTYLSEADSGDWGDDEVPLPDFVELAEQIPTLVLQEVLAKRLEESV